MLEEQEIKEHDERKSKEQLTMETKEEKFEKTDVCGNINAKVLMN